MSMRAFATLAAVLVLVLFGTGTRCGGSPPSEPVLIYPYQGGFGAYCTAEGGKQVLYAVNWGDRSAFDTTLRSYPSGETVALDLHHTWADTGTYAVRARALLAENPDKASGWSEPVFRHIQGNLPPYISEFWGPPLVPLDSWLRFGATAVDPDSDSVSVMFDFGTGQQRPWSPFVPSGTMVRDSFVLRGRPETLYAKCRARDVHGAQSYWSDSVWFVVGEAGLVIWYWFDYDPIGEREWFARTSPVVVFDEGDEFIYTTTNGSGIFGVKTSGRRRRSGGPVLPMKENEFTGHPAYCAATEHIIAGCEDGELYAFKLSLSKAWHWPGNSNEEELTYVAWGTAAINGDKLYVPRENDSLYCIVDQVDSGSFLAACHVPDIGDPPVIDAGGYVYVGTETGYLYRLSARLSLRWKTLLGAGSEIRGLAVGADGTVYCSSGSGRVFAVEPSDGSIKWTAVLDGEAYQIAVSPTALFVGTGSGKFYSVNPATGDTNWVRRENAYAAEIATNPILAGDLVYYQDNDDVLWCRRQSDGALLWSCDCTLWAPTAGRLGNAKGGFRWQPAILSDGNVIVVGEDAMYCVAGYEDRPLMNAPWPKWQHDPHNTGKAGE